MTNAELFVREFKVEQTPFPRGWTEKSDLKTLDSLVPAAWKQEPLLSSPLDLEIGCGVGLHPIQYTAAHPQRRMIAVEHTTSKYAGFAARILHHENCSNLLPVHADAIQWVTHLVPRNSLSKVFILYPNPEPKAANKRWMRAPFMHQLLSKLMSGGELIMATNIAEYYQEAMLYGRGFWKLEVAQERSFDQGTRPMEKPRTHFEKKYLLRGDRCYDVTFIKP